jgi:RHS repeat-associated protein
MRTTYNGGVAGSYFSLPFGDGYAASGTDADPNHFATLDQDSETETEHAQFRQYSSAQGHWLSPDPYDGSYDLTNPQSFNRYAYAGNNPLSFNDPSGLYIVPGCGGCWGAGNQNTGETGGDGEFSVYDTVDTYAGSYSYSGDVWDATMADGFGGGVQGGMNGPLYSSDETGDQFLGYVWQSMLLTGSPGIVSGTVVAPSNKNPFKEWPLNGNITPGTYQQDQKCSAGPVIGPPMDSLPGVLDACQWHDNKYIEYNCNATSWISPFPGPCKAINYMLLIKIYNALPIKPF